MKSRQTKQTTASESESVCAGCGGCSGSGCRAACVDPAAIVSASESESCSIHCSISTSESGMSEMSRRRMSWIETGHDDRGLVHRRQPYTLPRLHRQLHRSRSLMLLLQREQRGLRLLAERERGMMSSLQQCRAVAQPILADPLGRKHQSRGSLFRPCTHSSSVQSANTSDTLRPHFEPEFVCGMQGRNCRS